MLRLVTQFLFGFGPIQGVPPVVARPIGNEFNLSLIFPHNFQDLIVEVNLNRLFCETDAPYLSPFKDKKNEPAFVVEAYKKIAEIKKLDLVEVMNNLWMNYERVFK